MNVLEIAAEFREECEEDYVGLWQLGRRLAQHLNFEDSVDTILEVANLLLQDGRIVVGQFEENQFLQWTGSRKTQLQRLRNEMLSLQRLPDIGEIAWFASRNC